MVGQTDHRITEMFNKIVEEEFERKFAVRLVFSMCRYFEFRPFS